MRLTTRISACRAAVPLAVAAAVLSRGDAAAGCSCRLPPPPQEALAQADAVFVGLVQESVAQDVESAPGSRVAVTFSVLRSWKGVEEPSVTVYTGANTAVCGYPFDVGRRYLVYATVSDPGMLATNMCTRTAEEDAAQSDISALGPGRPSIGGH